MRAPRVRGRLKVPRFVVPSCNWNTGWMLPPQMPPAVNENAWVTEEPPARSAPYVAGALGNATLFDCSKVATRFVVFRVPMFLMGNAIVRVSPGSRAPLGGVQFSARIVGASTTMMGI